MNEAEYEDRVLELKRKHHACIEMQVEEARYRRYDLNEIIQLIDQMILGESPTDLIVIRDRLKRSGW
jgi:hypothetical protein